MKKYAESRIQKRDMKVEKRIFMKRKDTSGRVAGDEERVMGSEYNLSTLQICMKIPQWNPLF
jgi:hypothetical protein